MTMKSYRVSVWASVDVQAENESDACDKAYELVRGQEIKMRDYTFDAEETDGDI